MSKALSRPQVTVTVYPGVIISYIVYMLCGWFSLVALGLDDVFSTLIGWMTLDDVGWRWMTLDDVGWRSIYDNPVGCALALWANLIPPLGGPKDIEKLSTHLHWEYDTAGDSCSCKPSVEKRDPRYLKRKTLSMSFPSHCTCGRVF